MTTSTHRATRGRSTKGAIEPRGDAAPVRAVGDVEAATRRDIDGLAALDKDLAQSGLAASAIAMAREIDNPKNSATSKSMCARALREALDRLLELAPPKQTRDGIDKLRERAGKKLEGKTTA